MKKLLVLSLLIISLHCFSQEFILKTTSANIISSKVLIDVPALAGNPLAIIIITPEGNSQALNPHPIGAWYYSGKWNLFNSDHAVMPPGLTYKVKYYLNPGPLQFLHLVTQQNLGSDGSYIDNAALNNHPNAQFAIFQNHAPDIRSGSSLNQHEANAGYSIAAGKWYIKNVAGQPLFKGTAYNISISSSGQNNSGPVPLDNPAGVACKCPVSLPPNGPAGGDLVGPYPDPMVRKILGRPLSNTAPTIGQILKWNGTEWSPSNESGTTGNTYYGGLGITINGNEIGTLPNTPMWNASKIADRDIMTTPPTVGQVLKWGGGAWYPADDNIGTATSSPAPAIKTYYRYPSTVQGQMEAAGVAAETKIPSISGITITVTVTSTLVISASCYARAYCPSVGSCPLSIEFYYKVNNNAVHPFAFSGAEYLTGTISNHFYDVGPGTYTIDFYSRKRSYYNELNYSAAGGYATVMVLPK
jgi:hypothetical protein